MAEPLEWVGSSKRDLLAMPKPLHRVFGHALNEVQEGRTPDSAKSFTQAGGGVMEIVEDHNRSTYRAMYTAKLPNAVYVLHCFQKKAKSGKATPKPDIEMIEQRLKVAQEHSRQVMRTQT